MLEEKMDEATAKLITAIATGHAAATAAVLAILIRKGVITAEEILSALEGSQDQAAQSGLPETALPLRTVREFLVRQLEKPQSPRAH
jgi:hypothetical protein